MHQKIPFDKTQFRTGNAKPTFRCEQCGHKNRTAQVEIQPSLYRLWRLILLKFYRDSTGYVDHSLRDDAKGRAFLLAQLVLGLQPDDAKQLAPWVTPQNLRAIRKKAAHIEPTLFSISLIIKLTSALREKYGWRMKDGKRVRSGILVFPACDETSEQAERRRKADRNAARNAKRQKAQAERMARFTPREFAVIEAMIRLSRQSVIHHPDYDYPVPDIIRNIDKSDDRAAFPRNHTSFVTIVHRTFDQLRRKGVVKTKTTGKRGRQVRLIDFTLSSGLVRTYFGLTPTLPAKPLKYRELALTLSGSDQGMVPQVEGLDAETSKWLADEEVRASSVPSQPTPHPVVADRLGDEEVQTTAVADQAAVPVEAKVFHWRIGHAVGTPIRTHDEDDQLELASLRQRIAVLESKIGVRADPQSHTNEARDGA